MNLYKLPALIAAISLPMLLGAQVAYTSYFTGDTADVQTIPMPGLVLAGGGTDNDDAMRWMLARAGGGDVVVIRASGSNGYNDYFYSELGIAVNSVHTIRFNSAAAALDPYVINQIRGAEVLFIAGGDQYNYYSYWKDTPVEDAIQYLISEKQATVGGTSAGMAILGQAYYTPPGSGVTTAEALANPFHPNTEIIGYDDFLHHPYTGNLITDTHYDQRNRSGRHVVFMARLAQSINDRSYGIACNEYTAVCIDGEGIARVFGDYPNYDDYAYFLQVNCEDLFLPETLEAGTPLHWERNFEALKVYALPGTPTGDDSVFDLNDWQTGHGGNWQNWYVLNGQLMKNTMALPANCETTDTDQPPVKSLALGLFPNPANDRFYVVHNDGDVPILRIKVFNALGHLYQTYPGQKNEIICSDWPSGWYYIIAETPDGAYSGRLLKRGMH